MLKNTIALSWMWIRTHRRFFPEDSNQSAAHELEVLQRVGLVTGKHPVQWALQRNFLTDTKTLPLKSAGPWQRQLVTSNYRGTRINDHWAFELLFKVSYWRHDQLRSRVEKPPPPSPLPLWEQNLWPSKLWRGLSCGLLLMRGFFY